MDIISGLGLLVGIAAIVGGQLLEGGHIGSLVQPTAFIIVIGGTFGAVMLQSPTRTFQQGIKMGAWVLFPPVVDPQKVIAQITEWSSIARKEGLLALETHAEQVSGSFQRKGIQLLVDGAEPDRLRDVLEV
jgi:chemotaxis protein MotA